MARKQHLGGFFVSLFLFLERSEKPFTHWRTHQFHKHTRTIKHTQSLHVSTNNNRGQVSGKRVATDE
uniref:Putative secreted protein n=1 Tax=Anopheles darlingi TaxID=43151 RepID=A0A2M4DCX1_ANODA